MPSFEYENSFEKQYGIVAGTDEAGRGPWAGPVVAASVIVKDKERFKRYFEYIDDSKKLSRTKRLYYYNSLTQSDCLTFSIGISTVEEIDEYNILNATFLAMQRSLNNLNMNAVLVDGNRPIKGIEVPNFPIIKGDSKSYSIAAASIIAKVHRDTIMENLSKEFPEYKWDKNSGYGTKDHIEAINKKGITQHHRKSYAPIRILLEK